MRVAICIVNWNGFEDTKACLASLTRHCKDADIFLIENGSGQEEMLRGILDNRTELFVSIENLGFGGGNNILIREAINRGYDFVYLLNNDTEVTEGFLEEPQRLMEEPGVGFVSSKLILKGTGRIDTAGHWHLNSGDVIPAGRGRPASEFSENRTILSGCAAALLLRTRMIEDIGLFRDEFFLGYEDVDLTYRASVMGWRGVYCASSVVKHSLNASIGKSKNREYYVTSQRNNILAYLYNTPAIIIFLNTPWIIMKYLAILLYALLARSRLHASIHLKSLRLALKSLKEKPDVRAGISRKMKISAFRLFMMQRNFIPQYIKLGRSLLTQLKSIGT